MCKTDNSERIEIKSEMFSGDGFIKKYEDLIDFHKAIITVVKIYTDFDFEKDTGNAFQGNVQKTWLRSIIEGMIESQFHKMNDILDLYTTLQETLEGKASE